LSSQSKSGAIDQLTLGDRPVDRDRRVGHPCYRRTVDEAELQ